MTRKEKIFNAIKKAVSNGACEWGDIMQSVNEEKITIKNWMVVRGILQWMLDEKMIVRVANVHKEQYTLA